LFAKINVLPFEKRLLRRKLSDRILEDRRKNLKVKKEDGVISNFKPTLKSEQVE